MNPIFQGTYSSRIELKHWMRTDERLIATAEKLGARSPQWLEQPFEHRRLWEGWEPVLFSETHDTASGVMTDHVYEDTVRSYEFAKKIADDLIDESWDRLTDSVDTSGQGTPIVVFNTLSWPRSELVEVNLGFADSGVKGVAIADSNRKALAVQLISANRNPDGGLKEARIAFVARDIPDGLCGFSRDAAAGSNRGCGSSSRRRFAGERELSRDGRREHRCDQKHSRQGRRLGCAERSWERGRPAGRSRGPI